MKHSTNPRKNKLYLIGVLNVERLGTEHPAQIALGPNWHAGSRNPSDFSCPAATVLMFAFPILFLFLFDYYL